MSLTESELLGIKTKGMSLLEKYLYKSNVGKKYKHHQEIDSAFNEKNYTSTKKINQMLEKHEVVPNDFYTAIDVVKSLVKNDVVIDDYFMVKVLEDGDVESIVYAVKNGGNPNFSDGKAVKIAIKEGRLDAVEALVENGLDLHQFKDPDLGENNAINHDFNNTYGDMYRSDSYPLRIALDGDFPEIVDYIIKNGPEIDKERLLKRATDYKKEKVSEYLLKEGVNLGPKCTVKKKMRP